MFATAVYVANVLGQKFVEPPMLDLGECFGDSSPVSPLLFILSAGLLAFIKTDHFPILFFLHALWTYSIGTPQALSLGFCFSISF